MPASNLTLRDPATGKALAQGQGLPSTTNAPTTAPVSITGVPELDDLYNRLAQYVGSLQSQGQTINPNIELTPATVQQFLNQAQNEVQPYYSSQINSMQNELSSSLNNMQTQYNLAKQDQLATFKQNLNNTKETAAGNGLAQSGFKGQQIQQVGDAAQRNIDELTGNAASSSASALYNGAQTLGSRSVADLAPLGSFDGTKVSTAGAGGFGTTGASMSSYNPTDITGSLQYQENADTRNLSDFLDQQEIAKRSLAFTG